MTIDIQSHDKEKRVKFAMKKIIAVIFICILCIMIGLFIYIKYFATVYDKDGMTNQIVTVEITPHNSGTDEFGIPTGYGYGESVSFEVMKGDCLYETYTDTFKLNPSKSELENTYQQEIRIISVDAESVTISMHDSEYTISYDEKFTVSSELIVLDGASTIYTFLFRK